MKTLKINLVAVLAVMIGVATLSSQLVAKISTRTFGWHLVEYNPVLQKYEIKDPVGGPGEDCEINEVLDEMCAVQYDPDIDDAEYVEDLLPSTPRNTSWRGLP